MLVDTSVDILTDTSIQYPHQEFLGVPPRDASNWGGGGAGGIGGSLQYGAC